MLKSLNKGTVFPGTIIIALPPNAEKQKLFLKNKKVKIVQCPIKGQVYQRLMGFKTAKSNFVLQLDDDISLKKDCLELLFKKIKKSNASAVGPSYFWTDTKKSIYEKKIEAPWLYHLICNGTLSAPAGKISKSGEPFGYYQRNRKVKNHENVDWLPGGCILHRRENLILESYYPFVGKAFGEDLIHSKKLKEKGIQLFVVPEAKVFIKKSNQKIKIFEILKMCYRLHKIRQANCKKSTIWQINNNIVFVCDLIQKIFSYARLF